MIKPKSEPSTSVGCLVGRFQVNELHSAHMELIQTVCNNHSKVIIFLGISLCLATKNNPLDFESRKQMILDKFPNVNVLYIKDVNDDRLWSQNLDEHIGDLISPTQTVTLYGGRDSFIKHYFGKHKTQELESDRIISGSTIRKELSNKVKPDSSFRAGVIWALYNQYPKVYTTVDVAILNEDSSKVLLCRKKNEKLYQFVGGFSEPKSPSFEYDGKREVLEETGLEVGELVYLGSSFVDDFRYLNEVDKIKTIFFKTKYLFGSPKANDDVVELAWIEIKNLKENVVSMHQPLVQLLIRNLNEA